MIPEEGKTFVTVEGDRVPQTWVERRPDRRFLQVNSKPLTVPHEVNSWYVAKVLYHVSVLRGSRRRFGV